MDLKHFEKMPPVGAAMTPFPYFVDAGDVVETIERLMAEHEIRHVPVQEHGRVVGVISERDLDRLALHARSHGVDRTAIRARDILAPDPYVVELHVPLDAVAAEMSRRRIGSAIVVKRGKLAGILSVTDVCRVLAEVLRERFPSAGGDDAA